MTDPFSPFNAILISHHTIYYPPLKSFITPLSSSLRT